LALETGEKPDKVSQNQTGGVATLMGCQKEIARPIVESPTPIFNY
jgi:hypothetical protein